MNLLSIAWKSLRQRAVSSSLTALSVALGVSLMVTVLVIHSTVTQLFNQSATGYDLVVGAKGSPLQLVLNTIFYLDRPIENIPYKYYQQVRKLRAVKQAIPFALGDSTADGRYRIVGTMPEYFDVEYIPKHAFRFSQGRRFEKAFEAVIGIRVARTYGWTVGSEFPIAHGGNTEDIHAEKFTVVGVLEATGTPSDRAVYVHLDGFFQMSGHEKPLAEAQAKERQIQGEEQDLSKPIPQAIPNPTAASEASKEIPDEQKEVTAILVHMKEENITAIPMLAAKINDGLVAQAVNPLREIRQLMRNIVGNIQTILLVMISMIILVSGIGIFVSIYNSMSDRRREIAVMRALGASRGWVLRIIVCESLLICLLGGVIGFAMGHLMVFIAAPIIEARSDTMINPWSFDQHELWILPSLLLLGSVVGIVPGLTAYRTDVAKGLQS